MERKTAPWPWDESGSACVSVQLMSDGLKLAAWRIVNTMESVAPVGVSIHTGPVSAAEGTVVTMNSFVQFSGRVTGASTGWPDPSLNQTWDLPSRSPNDLPSKITVLPLLPLGFDTPLTALRLGATAL